MFIHPVRNASTLICAYGRRRELGTRRQDLPDHVDRQPRRNKIPSRAAPEGRHISFEWIVPVSMKSAQASHLLPVYARVDLAFER
ncbi:MAG TPA: hypothetical protein VNC81_15840, partial [Xanthobacteraceae bacterium]|nr:hypothetical protein [Xanthobacteraceae bacterium]